MASLIHYGLESFDFQRWQWVNVRRDGQRATVQIDAPGQQHITVWMREDGIHFDRILFTTNADFEPHGLRLAESPRAGQAHTRLIPSEDYIGAPPARSTTPAAPEAYAINCYPNPFNPTTTISIDLPEPGWVLLKVYNAIGQEVATLIEGYKEAGTHRAIFDGAGLSSGIYFYRLDAEHVHATNSMVLEK